MSGIGGEAEVRDLRLKRLDDPKEQCRRKRRDDCLSFKGPSQPGNRRCNDLMRIAAEAQHQRRLRRCLNIQAAHCTNDDAVFSPCPFDRDV